MRAEGIEGISFSFTAGVATAAALDAGAGAGALTLGTALCLLAGAYASSGHKTPLCLMLAGYFALGMFAFCSQNLPSPGRPMMSGQLQTLCGTIDRIPFRHPGSNSLVKALLTGVRDSLSEEQKACFRCSGAAHILALSGLHLGVIYGILSRAFRIAGNSPLARQISSCATMICCAVYTILTGAGPSVVRAFIFICLNEVARLSPQRRRSPVKIYCCALLIQLSLSPASIRSLSFQLSYLAMCGIVLLFPILSSWYPADPNGKTLKGPVRKIWDCIALSISCQCFTAPLSCLRFKMFPRYFLLSNLIGLPLSELLIISSVLCVGLSAAGICPNFLAQAVDGLCQCLTFCLKAISSM